MSPVRTHFWIEVARGYGGGTCPRKYGLNCTMPALTKSRFGSSRISEALGTRVCPAFVKCSVKRRVISWVCTVGFQGSSGRRARAQSPAASGTWDGRGTAPRTGPAARSGPCPARSRARSRSGLGFGKGVAHRGQRRPGAALHELGELPLPLGHPGAHLGAERTQAGTQLPQAVGEVGPHAGRGEAAGRLGRTPR